MWVRSFIVLFTVGIFMLDWELHRMSDTILMRLQDGGHSANFSNSSVAKIPGKFIIVIWQVAQKCELEWCAALMRYHLTSLCQARICANGNT